MVIENTTLETINEYGSERYTRKYFLKLSFKIPGGEAVFKIPSEETINTALEDASKLAKKMPVNLIPDEIE